MWPKREDISETGVEKNRASLKKDLDEMREHTTQHAHGQDDKSQDCAKITAAKDLILSLPHGMNKMRRPRYPECDLVSNPLLDGSSEALIYLQLKPFGSNISLPWSPRVHCKRYAHHCFGKMMNTRFKISSAFFSTRCSLSLALSLGWVTLLSLSFI